MTAADADAFCSWSPNPTYKYKIPCCHQTVEIFSLYELGYLQQLAPDHTYLDDEPEGEKDLFAHFILHYS